MDVPEDDVESVSDEDCCGSGCNPCILDVRKKLLKEKKSSPSQNALDPSKYVKFVISDIRIVAEEYLIFILKLKDPIQKDLGIIFKIGQYIILQSDSVSRSYTPISWTNETVNLLVKLYKDGKMSNLIRDKKVDDEIDVRGPYGDFLYQRNSYTKIIMFSIGSGIAVMYPIINSIILDDLEDTRIYLNASFRYFSIVPFKEELRRLADYWNFSCTLFLTQEKNINLLTGVKLINNTRLSVESIKNIIESSENETTLILICGTKEFNNMAKTTIEQHNYNNFYIFD